MMPPDAVVDDDDGERWFYLAIPAPDLGPPLCAWRCGRAAAYAMTRSVDRAEPVTLLWCEECAGTMRRLAASMPP